MARAECLYYGSVHNYHRGTDYMYNNSGFSGTREAVPIVETVHRERLKCILQSLVYQPECLKNQTFSVIIMSSIRSSLFEFVPSFPKSFYLCHAFNMCSDIKYLSFCLLHNFEPQNILVIEGHRGHYSPVFCVYLPQSLVCCLLSSFFKKCNKTMLWFLVPPPPTIKVYFTDIMCTFV